MIRVLEPMLLMPWRQFNSRIIESTKTALMKDGHEWLLRIQYTTPDEKAEIEAFYDRNFVGRTDCVSMDSIETMSHYWMIYGATGDDPQVLFKLGFGT